MKRHALFLSILTVLVITVSGQTAAELGKKYSSSLIYEIRPKVLMTAEFDEFGQICSASLQANKISRTARTNYLGNDTLDPLTLREVFDELAPPDARIGQYESLGFHMTGTMGFSAVAWENVRFNLKYSLSRRDKRPLDLSRKGKEGFDLLFVFTPLEPDLASVTWTQRKCSDGSI